VAGSTEALLLTTYLICLAIGGTMVLLSVGAGGDHEAGADGLVMDADAGFDVDADADFDAHLDMDAGDVDGMDALHLDADADADADAGDAHLDVDGHDVALIDGVASLFPLASIRFWTFLLAAGGLTGTLLTFFAALGTIPTAAISLVVGYACGLGVTLLMRKFLRENVSSGIDVSDCVGANARVLLPIASGQVGKVRVRVGNKDLDLTAETEDGIQIGIDDEVLVYEVRDDGTAWVTADKDKTNTISN